jgi:plastocyanin
MRKVGVIAAAVAALALVPGASAATTPTVVVTLTDTALTFSPKAVKVGTVTFAVRNRAHTPRDFRVNGKKTGKIPRGKSATLNVAFTRMGEYGTYSAARGNTPSTAGILLRVEAPCENGGTSTVTVTLGELPVQLSQTSVPCGTATFVVTNTGTTGHSFVIGGKTTGRLGPGQMATLTVPLTQKGLAHYFCAERLHDEFYHEYGDILVG